MRTKPQWFLKLVTNDHLPPLKTLAGITEVTPTPCTSRALERKIICRCETISGPLSNPSHKFTYYLDDYDGSLLYQLKYMIKHYIICSERLLNQGKSHCAVVEIINFLYWHSFSFRILFLIYHNKHYFLNTCDIFWYYSLSIVCSKLKSLRTALQQ